VEFILGESAKVDERRNFSTYDVSGSYQV